MLKAAGGGGCYPAVRGGPGAQPLSHSTSTLLGLGAALSDSLCVHASCDLVGGSFGICVGPGLQLVLEAAAQYTPPSVYGF